MGREKGGCPSHPHTACPTLWHTRALRARWLVGLLISFSGGSIRRPRRVGAPGVLGGSSAGGVACCLILLPSPSPSPLPGRFGGSRLALGGAISEINIQVVRFAQNRPYRRVDFRDPRTVCWIWRQPSRTAVEAVTPRSFRRRNASSKVSRNVRRRSVARTVDIVSF